LFSPKRHVMAVYPDISPKCIKMTGVCPVPIRNVVPNNRQVQPLLPSFVSRLN
jgi:hypothetical protein